MIIAIEKNNHIKTRPCTTMEYQPKHEENMNPDVKDFILHGFIIEGVGE